MNAELGDLLGQRLGQALQRPLGRVILPDARKALIPPMLDTWMMWPEPSQVPSAPPSASPYGEENGATMLTVSDADQPDSSAMVYVTVAKAGGPLTPYFDGNTPASAVAFKMTLHDVSGSASIFVPESFKLEPSGGGSPFTSGSDISYERNKTLDKKLCGKLPLLDKALNADAQFGWTLHEGDDFTGCIIFDYFSPAHPTMLTFTDTTPSAQTQTIWKGTLTSNSGKRVAPVQLAMWSGPSSQLLLVPSAATRAVGVRICWDMKGTGNHIIEVEDTTAGGGLVLLTNTVGSEDKQCMEATGSLKKYIQVLAEDNWTITITGYKTG